MLVCMVQGHCNTVMCLDCIPAPLASCSSTCGGVEFVSDSPLPVLVVHLPSWVQSQRDCFRNTVTPSSFSTAVLW